VALCFSSQVTLGPTDMVLVAQCGATHELSGKWAGVWRCLVEVVLPHVGKGPRLILYM
jgi:hypothetical protein